MKRFLLFLPALVVQAATLISCVRDAQDLQPGSGLVKMEIVPENDAPDTRSILDAGKVEAKISNMLVLLYRSSNGRFDKKYICDENHRSIQVLSGISYDIFVLANVENPSRINPPEYESSLEKLEYVIPSYESINKLGMPGCGTLRSVRLIANGSVEIKLKRLMAKVNVHISHGGLTGKPSNDASLFSNVKLYVRQANAVLSPFSPDGSRAVNGKSLLALSDYDPSMTDDGVEFVFYVPENMQGRLLPYNIDPEKKTETALESAGVDASVLTYIEYTGHLNSDAAGYGGDLVYRFYLGADNVGDFNVERNRVYDISLDLSQDRLFDTYWKVSHGENWKDSRVFRLLGKDGSILQDNAVLAVRPSHPAVIKLFANSDGSAVNMISSAVCGPSSGKVTGQGTLALRWTSNVISSDQSKLTLPSVMSREGLELEFDSGSGTLTVSQKDGSSLVQEKEYALEFYLDPDRKSYTRKVRVKVLPECSIENVPEIIYVAQRVPVRINGALGSYTAQLLSGSASVDVAYRDGIPCLFGKKEGSASVNLVSSDPLNDSDLSLAVSVNKVYFVRGPDNYLDIPSDGTDYNIPIYVSGDRYGRDKLDLSQFDREYMEKCCPISVSIKCTGDLYDLDKYLEVDPYAMTAHVKRLSYGGVQLDTADMNDNDLVHVIMNFSDGKEEDLNMCILAPFMPGDEREETLYADAWSKGYGENFITMPVYTNVPVADLSFEYSGKMRMEVSHPFPVAYRMTFPYSTQIQYLDKDVGTQYVTFIMTNIISGETIRSDRHYFKVEKIK